MLGNQLMFSIKSWSKAERSVHYRQTAAEIKLTLIFWTHSLWTKHGTEVLVATLADLRMTIFSVKLPWKKLLIWNVMRTRRYKHSSQSCTTVFWFYWWVIHYKCPPHSEVLTKLVFWNCLGASAHLFRIQKFRPGISLAMGFWSDQDQRSFGNCCR